MKFKLLAFLTLFLLTSCNVGDRLSRVGKSPDFNQVDTYEDKIYAEYEEKGFIHEPGQDVAVAENKSPNSLWRPGARSFFRDQRARAVGDILKVVVTIQDTARLNNSTETKRNEAGTTGIPHVMGFESKLGKILPGAVDADNLISTNTKDNNKGEATINRQETINTTVAATVVKILPSNNLIIKGSQEIKVNYEVREVTIEGIVRPEDISAQNSVTLDQVAEARVTYGGRGNLSDVQQPRYGKQVLDIISPF